jgi:hypothetical protein
MAFSNRYSSLERWDVLSPSSDSTPTSRKTASVNSCKNLRAIQRSDQKLWPFQMSTLVRSAETSAHRVAIPLLLQGKRCPQTPVKISGRPIGGIKSYGPFEPLLWSRAKSPLPHRVANPHLLQGKWRPETPVKFWGRSNSRIKSYGPFELGLWSRAQRPLPH